MSYISLEISLHGQKGNVNDIKNKIEKILRENLDLEYSSDLDVEVLMHSSGLVCEDKDCVNRD